MKKNIMYLVVFLAVLIVFLFFLQYYSPIREGIINDEGLNWKIYSGYHSEDVNFSSSLQPLTDSTGTALQGTVTDLSTLDIITNGAIQENQYSNSDWSMELVGLFIPTISGNWVFQTSSVCGSYLWIDTDTSSYATSGWSVGNATVNNGGKHRSQTISNKKNPVSLTAGKSYTIRIQAGCTNNKPNHLKVQWMPQPNGSLTSNGIGYFYNNGSSSNETTNDHQYYTVNTPINVNGAKKLNVNKQLLTSPNTPMQLATNWALSFTVNINKFDPNLWQQIIGVSTSPTGSSDPTTGDDYKVISVYARPIDQVGQCVNIWTAANTTNDNIYEASAIDPAPLPINANTNYRFDIVSNTVSGIQTISTYQTNLDQSTNIGGLVSTVQLAAPMYLTPPNTNWTNQGYIFTSFKTSNPSNTPMNGTLSNVIFVSGNTPITINNLINATNKMNSPPPPAPTCNEGYRGMGDTQGLSLSSDKPSSNTPPNPTPANNYQQIGNFCPKSVITANDPNINLLDSNGNYRVQIGSDLTNAGTVPICNPDDLYGIQKQILNELNQFNSDYSNFVIYKYNKNFYTSNGHQGRTDTPLKFPDGTPASQYTKYANFDSINSIDALPSYQTLNKDLQTYGNLLKANKAYYPDPIPGTPSAISMASIDPAILAQNHTNIVNMRNDLDTKLFELNNGQNSAYGTSKKQMDSSVYITILWTTLATSLVYFMFVQI